MASEKKQRVNWKEKIFVVVLTFVFILPAIIIKDGPRFLYTVLAGVIGWSVGKEIIWYINKDKKRKKEQNKNIWLRNPAISAYVLIYIVFSIIIDFEFFKIYFLTFLLKMMFGSYTLYIGLKSIQTKKAWLRGFPLTKKDSVLMGVLLIIISLLVLLSKLIFT